MINTINLLALGALFAVASMLVASSDAEAAIFMKIDGVPGDVSIDVPGYDNGEWFEIDSFDFGVNNDRGKGKESGEKGGTADINIGVGELQECTISKSMDSATGKLAQFAINGNSLGRAEIDFVEVAGGGDAGAEKPIPYLVYKLDRTFVKSWTTSADADDRPVEEVAFYYNKIAFAYTPTDDGVEDRNNSMSWDNVKNIPWTEVLDELFAILFPEPEPEPQIRDSDKNQK